ncbi:hypothetical protein NUW54_g12251 [Trametes sanguinea]|uniref:Uncharacterized protein n=1 Tax=Trametes sanguinea TaxID=158606 RepID=A0ACC1N096_9APHY|nr:hypothetical protein NUW54_g12251 [Trametes sanguinea]
MGPNLRKKRGGGARAGQLCSLPKMQKATAALKAPPGTFGCLQLKQNDVGALQLVEAKSWQPPKPSAEQTTHTTSMSHGQTAASLEKKSPSPFDEPILAHSVPHANHSEIGVSQPGSFGHSNLNEQYAVASSVIRYRTIALLYLSSWDSFEELRGRWRSYETICNERRCGARSRLCVSSSPRPSSSSKLSLASWVATYARKQSNRGEPFLRIHAYATLSRHVPGAHPKPRPAEVIGHS